MGWDGIDTISLYKPNKSTWYIHNTNSDWTIADSDVGQFQYGSGDSINTPVVGDWDGNGTTTIGVYQPDNSIWSLRNSNSAGAPDITPFAFGSPNSTPLFIPSTAPKFTTPIGGKQNVDWVLSNYVNVGTPDAPRDYRGGGFTWDRSSGDEFSLANYAAADRGVPVLAAAQGVVIGAANDQTDHNTTPVIGEYVERGNYVFIDHGFGWYTSYFHMKQGSVTVRPGDLVTPGQQIGQVGGSGNTDRPRLLFYAAFGGRPVEIFDYPTKLLTAAPAYLGDARGVLDGGFTTQLWTLPELVTRPIEPNTVTANSSTVLYLWVSAFGIRATDVVTFNWLRPETSTPIEVARFTGRENRFRWMGIYIPTIAGDNSVFVEINGVEVFRKQKLVSAP